MEISSASYQAHYQLARALENTANYPGARKSYARARALTRSAGGMDARYYTALITAGLKRLDRKAGVARAAEPAAPGKERLYAACLDRFRAAAAKDDLLAAADLAAGCRKLKSSDVPVPLSSVTALSMPGGVRERMAICGPSPESRRAPMISRYSRLDGDSPKATNFSPGRH